MKAIKLISPALLVLAAVFVLAGCETESSDQIAISISPQSVTLEEGQSQEFKASGWQDYTWELKNSAIGILSTRKGDTTIYTAVKGPTSTNEIQVLTVSVNITSESSGGATNVLASTPRRVSAEALIQTTTPVEITPVETTPLEISPSTTTIQNGESVVLTAQGPDELNDFRWQLEEPVHGTLSGTYGSTTIFTATNGPAATDAPPFTQLLTLTAGGGELKVAATVTILGYER